MLSAKQGKVLQDTKEALANKAVDFSVVNDTKYPTTKAVSDQLALKSDKTYVDSQDQLLDDKIELLDGRVEAVELNVNDHEQRIDSIEAITRKQNSDIASVDDDGIGIMHMGKDVAETTVTTKIEGLLLDSEQLVTNGVDFTWDYGL